MIQIKFPILQEIQNWVNLNIQKVVYIAIRKEIARATWLDIINFPEMDQNPKSMTLICSIDGKAEILGSLYRSNQVDGIRNKKRIDLPCNWNQQTEWAESAELFLQSGSMKAYGLSTQ